VSAQHLFWDRTQTESHAQTQIGVCVTLTQKEFWDRSIIGTGRDSFRTISGTGLCHFRYGHSLGPVPKLGSMRVVPFPGRGPFILEAQ
jgi:hypothetical protein